MLELVTSFYYQFLQFFYLGKKVKLVLLVMAFSVVIAVGCITKEKEYLLR